MANNNEDNGTCLICNSASNQIVNIGCNHKYCRNCLILHLSTNINQDVPITCPSRDCQTNLNNQVKLSLLSESKLIKLYTELSTEGRVQIQDSGLSYAQYLWIVIITAFLIFASIWSFLKLSVMFDAKPDSWWFKLTLLECLFALFYFLLLILLLFIIVHVLWFIYLYACNRKSAINNVASATSEFVFFVTRTLAPAFQLLAIYFRACPVCGKCRCHCPVESSNEGANGKRNNQQGDKIPVSGAKETEETVLTMASNSSSNSSTTASPAHPFPKYAKSSAMLHRQLFTLKNQDVNNFSN